MGLLLMGANGKRRDAKAALDWYLSAAERGHSHAQYTLGWMLVNGEGVPADRAGALPWLRKANAQGNHDAADLLKQLGYQADSPKCIEQSPAVGGAQAGAIVPPEQRAASLAAESGGG